MELIIDVNEPTDKVKGTLIRCENCRHSEPCRNLDLAESHVWCTTFDFAVEKNWYCGDGKRRE